MDTSLLSFAILIEVIIFLVVWIIFIHWRLSKKKKALNTANDIEVPDPFEVYLQFINRELSETKIHLDDLLENQSDDRETIHMYQYRHKHLDAEQKAMSASKGDTAQFWELYRSTIDFIYTENEKKDDVNSERDSQPEIQSPQGLEEQLDQYNNSSKSIVEQSNNVIELVQKLAAKEDSEELAHMLGLLNSEKDGLISQLNRMEEEYARLMNNAALQSRSVMIDSNIENGEMSKVIAQQHSRVAELNDIVGNLSLELEDKKRLIQETEWVTRQLKETEHVIVILEDENSFLRDQIKQLLESQG